MTGATPQIFDLMLGPSGTSPDGLLAGGDPGAVGDAPLFVNLLGGFLEGQPLGRNAFDLQQLLAGVNPEQAGTTELPNPLAESEVEEFNDPKLASGINGSDPLPTAIDHAAFESLDFGKGLLTGPKAIGLSPVSKESDAPSLASLEGTLVGNSSAGADKLNPSQALFPETAAIQNQSLKDIFSGGQIMVRQGKYKIIESEVSKGQLNLTVVSSESPTEQIKISLPLKTLLQGGNFSPGRTALSGVATAEPSLMDGPVLEDYISKLKLTSLEVESSVATDAKRSVVKLFSGTAGRQLLMLSHLDGNGLVGRRKLLQNHTDKVGGGSVDIDEALFDRRAGVEAPAARSARPWNDPLPGRLHSMTGKLDQKLTMLSTASDPFGETADGVRMNDLIGPDAKVERSSLDGDGVKTRTTRLILPEDVRTALKPGGQSVTLRIEPEHLGPARLRLSMHNNVLKALVTVDSTQAKLVVEGSLDQLTNQLSKADIQVDRIEVALNSDSRHDQFLHRRPRRQASLKTRRGVDVAPAVMTMAVSEDRYGVAPGMGAGGVNLLA